MEVTVPDYKILPKVSLSGPEDGGAHCRYARRLCQPQEENSLFPTLEKPSALYAASWAKHAKRGSPIIYIQDWHRPDDPEFSIWGPHAIQETPGTRVIPELAPAPKDYLVRKRTYDPFFSTDLDLLLRQKSIQNLIVTGTVANICVLHAAGSADLRGYEVIVPIDTISALNPFDFQTALRQISFVYQGKLTYSQGISFTEKMIPRDSPGHPLPSNQNTYFPAPKYGIHPISYLILLILYFKFILPR